MMEQSTLTMAQHVAPSGTLSSNHEQATRQQPWPTFQETTLHFRIEIKLEPNEIIVVVG